MLSKQSIKTMLVSAVAASVASGAGVAAADMLDTPANSNTIKIGKNGCEGKTSCEGHAKEGAEMAQKAQKEKCYGVVKAGKNDCAAADKSHSCAGMAEADGSPNEWVAVPAGACDKLVGGSTTPPAE